MQSKLFNLFKKKECNWASKMPRNIANKHLLEIKLNPQVCGLDEIPQGIGKFGLEKSNPIPVFGTPSIEYYLKKLRTYNGERIMFKKVASSEIDNITKPINEYEILNTSGEAIASLYLSPYHWKTSSKAPEGFKLN